MKKVTDILADATLLEMGWAKHENGWLRSRE